MITDTQITSIYALTASPNFHIDGIVFAASQRGVQRSADGGQTWEDAYARLDLPSPLATTALACTGNGHLFAAAPGAVLRSIDNGLNWTIALLPSPPPFVTALAISPDYERDATLFAGTLEDGVFCSRDRGQRWAAWNFGLLDLSVLTLAPSPGFVRDETIFAATESGIFISTNGGRAWRETPFPVEFSPVTSLAISPGFVRDGALFAGTERSGVFRSDDRGMTWRPLSPQLIEDAIDALILSPRFPEDETMLILHRQTLSLSHDGGETLKPLSSPIAGAHAWTAVTALDGLDRRKRMLAGAADGGVYVIELL